MPSDMCAKDALVPTERCTVAADTSALGLNLCNQSHQWQTNYVFTWVAVRLVCPTAVCSIGRLRLPQL